MKKLIFIVILFYYAFTIKAQPKLILNGLFELNNSTDFLTEFNKINELNDNNKHFVKIVDVLCKEKIIIKNTSLFYIYSNGTVEKKLIIE